MKKAQINWALERAEGLWFCVADRPPKKDFIEGIAKLLRQTRREAISTARGRIKVILHRENLGLTDEQKKRIFAAMDRIG